MSMKEHLYQNNCSAVPAHRDSLADALTDAATAILAEQGLAAASARAIAKRADTRPSAINYWFGGRDGLVERALDLHVERHTAMLDDLAGAFVAIDPGAAGAVAMYLSAAHQLGDARRSETLIAWSVAMEAQASERLLAAARSTAEARRRFWRRIGDLAGLDGLASQAVGDAMEWLCRGALFTTSPVIFDAFLNDACVRLLDRASGVRPTRPGDSMWRAALAGTVTSSTSPPTPENGAVKSAIVDAAILLLVEHGPNALTHRAIAQASGASLSSTTYHFASLGEIVGAAYQHLYVRARERSRALIEAPRGTRVEDIGRSAAGDFSNAGRREFAAMQHLLLAAARKPSLRPFADAAFAQMGEGSTRILSGLQHARPDLDRLDGFLWRMITTTLFERSIHSLAGASEFDDTSWLGDYTRRLFCD